MGVYLRGKSYYYNFYYEGKRYNEKIGPVSKSVALEKLDIKRREVIRGNGNQRLSKFLSTNSKSNILNFLCQPKGQGHPGEIPFHLNPFKDSLVARGCPIFTHC